MLVLVVQSSQSDSSGLKLHISKFSRHCPLDQGFISKFWYTVWQVYIIINLLNYQGDGLKLSYKKVQKLGHHENELFSGQYV